ncbi:MAG TPA: TatD family hydrolase [Acidimicrobiia bacterium]|nr:TatD family hydrolase [Acidimicrobiia bacterium]
MTPLWVDSHCHLFMASESPGALLDRAAAAGVGWAMCPGTGLAESLAARKVAEEHPDRVRWSAGLHPHEASEWSEVSGRIEALAADADAIGECGLDYYRNLSPREDQQRAFAAQLELAVALDKPVIVHCRDAFGDVYAALEQAALAEKAVLHCWTGGPKWTKRFAQLGVTFSFAGPVAFSAGDTVRLAAAVAPPERTMVETDTPYLTPPPHRDEGKTNEPAFVPLIGAALAKVWSVDVAEVARLTTATAERLFGRPGT